MLATHLEVVIQKADASQHDYGHPHDDDLIRKHQSGATMRNQPAKKRRAQDGDATHRGCALFVHVVSRATVFGAQNGLTLAETSEVSD